jgi:hypothetical protein
MNTRNA